MALAGVNSFAGKSPVATLAWVASRPALWPAVWVAAATLILVAGFLAAQSPALSQWLGDTDDAVRLLSVRELIAGAPWFDTTLPRIGAPEPLVSHWSRLVDAPLAAMMLALQPFVGAEKAELATRTLWPVLLFAGLAFIVARAAYRQGGAWAAAFAMLLAASSAMALTQFRPGRIDHHNVQILCAVGGIIFLAHAFRSPRSGWIAGALIGLGLAVGYEAIGLVIPILGAAALIALLNPSDGPSDEPSDGRGVVNAVVGAAGVLLLAFLVTTAPSRLLIVHCDALSLNLVVLAAVAAAGLWAAFALRMGLTARIGIAGLCTGLGAMLYVALEPACLAGPFGQVNDALKPVWLDHVLETQSIFVLMARGPSMAAAQLAFVLAGTAAALALFRRQRDHQSALMALAALLATVLGCWQIKLMPYAAWLAVLPMAVFAAGLAGAGSLSPRVVRIAALVLFSQTTMATLADGLLAPFVQQARANEAAADAAGDLTDACYRTDGVMQLARLPQGLIAADIDLGPYIAALTTHRVLAAPYHRLDQGILAISAIRRGTVDEARQRMTQLGVDYFATCATPRTKPPGTARTFRAQLLSGAKIAGFEEVSIGASPAIRVWRVVR